MPPDRNRVLLAGGTARFDRAVSRAGLAWLLLLRVFALFVASELSGLAHTGTDVYESFAGHEQHHEADCEEEEAGHECPPGCPNCHCAHASHAVVVLSGLACQTALTPLPTVARRVGFVPYAALVPSGADPASLYRPPRAHA